MSLSRDHAAFDPRLALSPPIDTACSLNNDLFQADCLLHGHSYTAHPVGCAAALEFMSQVSFAYTGSRDSLVDRTAWNTLLQ